MTPEHAKVFRLAHHIWPRDPLRTGIDRAIGRALNDGASYGDLIALLQEWEQQYPNEGDAQLLSEFCIYVSALT
jgi:hypothetical protein